jgi:hypothetical protein
VGESVLQIAPNAAAAYSLRSLTGGDPTVVRVRRGSDNHEQDFTASEVSAGALTSFVNAPVIAPLDLQALEADGRTGDFLIAKAAYSLRSLGTRQATLAATGDTVARANGKFVAQVRRNVNGDVKSFTADEVTDGTLLSFVNESFTSSLPLDVAGSAAAAYGLRNLSSSYTGNVVEVRRASDDTTQNFKAAEITDGTLLAFVGTGGSDNGFVKTWYDQSGNSNDAAQATAANQPKIVSAGALVTGGLDFDGSDDFLTNDTAIMNNAANAYASVVLSRTSTTSNEIPLSFPADSTGNRGFDLRLSSGTTSQLSIRTSAGSSNASGSFATASGSNVLLTGTFNAGLSSDEVKFFGNGSLVGSASNSGSGLINNGDNGGLFIGRFGSPTNFGAHLNGKVEEVIVYTSDQSDKRRAIEESIAGHHGITLGSFNRDGFVKTWYDQSVTNEAGDTATGNHATQATAASQPKIVSAGSLLNKLDFDGTANRLEIDFGSNLSQPNSIVMVHQSSTTVDVKNEFFDELGATGQRTLLDQSSTNYRIFAGSSATTNLAVDTNKNLITAIYNGASSIVAKNGTAQSGLNGNTQSISSTSAIGFSESTAAYYQGAMQEFIVYNSDQTANRTALEANIGEVYGIDLPSGVDPGFDQVDGFVETWYDQSGNGRDATQATAGSQPKIVDGGSYLGEVDFGGTDDVLNFTSIDFSTNPWFAASVFKYDNTASAIIGGGSTQWITNVGSSTNYSARNTQDSNIHNFVSSSAFVNGSINLVTVFRTGDTLSGSANGNLDSTASPVIESNDTFQADRLSLRGSTYGTFSIKEVILYNSDQSANRVALETNINSEYSIF